MKTVRNYAKLTEGNTMGKKDMVEKYMEEYEDVFADIVNVLLFDGEREVGENSLVPDEITTQYKADNILHEQERDISKYWLKGNVRLALFGLENINGGNFNENSFSAFI